MRIRYNEKGNPLQRTICGTSEEYNRPKELREQRGFSLRRLKDEFLCKPRAPKAKISKKFRNAKVMFNTGINTGRGKGNNEDPNSKTITVKNSEGSFTRVHAQRFTDENLKNYIQDYIQRK